MRSPAYVARCLSQSSVRSVVVAVVLLAGCSPKAQLGSWQGPKQSAIVGNSAWSFQGAPAETLLTAHYAIHTTATDPRILANLPQVMEGALAEYRAIAPGIRLSDRPLDCYVFATRAQWADFTRRHTGSDSPLYLQISRGGYTVHDWFVAYLIGERGTYSVSAHEGWHQFVAREFKGRIPPFLEEGLACLFETVTWAGNEPRWNLSINPNRTQGLRRAVESHSLFPLARLVTMHAGDVVNQPGERIEAFYAQCWAFAKFLWEADNGRYRPALRRLLTDTAAGTVYDPTHAHQQATAPWNPRGVRTILEHYLNQPLTDIDAAYTRYVHHVAYDEFDAQWRTPAG